MKMTLKDRSLYFKGLLLLIRKDRQTVQAEVEWMTRIGAILGFEKQFCAEAIADILKNPYIVDEPSRFSKKEVAACFIRDGLSLAFADEELHAEEEQWLRSTAELNSLGMDFFDGELEKARDAGGNPKRLFVEDLSL
ncbi:hypothetical protein JW906_04680 [bacterium]|nr:hypothetical protein [bacterium]